jgi:hypothetical protein
MKIKILKDEYVFSAEGFHICDENGFAKTAQEDCEIEIEDPQSNRVLEIIKKDREKRGLDENGNTIITSSLEDTPNTQDSGFTQIN